MSTSVRNFWFDKIFGTKNQFSTIMSVESLSNIILLTAFTMLVHKNNKYFHFTQIPEKLSKNNSKRVNRVATTLEKPWKNLENLAFPVFSK